MRYAFRIGHRGTTPVRRASQVPHPSVGTRCPTLPRGAGGLLTDAGSSRVDPFVIRAGFTESGRLAAPIVAFRGLNRGFTRVAARAFVSRGFDRPITRRDRPLHYICHRQFIWWTPFSSQDRV